MALYEISRVVDTVLTALQAEQIAYDTLAVRYMDDRFVSFFKGQRTSYPASSLPAVAVYPSGDQTSWFAMRVYQDEPSLTLDLVTDNGDPPTAVDLESKLVTLTQRILSRPAFLQAQIQGYPANLLDSLPGSVQYGQAGGGRVRVARITWTGKLLEYLANEEFGPLAGPQASICSAGQLTGQ